MLLFEINIPGGKFVLSLSLAFSIFLCSFFALLAYGFCLFAIRNREASY